MQAQSILRKSVQIYLQHRKHFFTFLLVGIGTTCIYFGLFSLLWYKLHFNHVASVSIAYIVAACYQFLLNRKFTFNVNSLQMPAEIARYITLLIFNYIISLLLVKFSLAVSNSPIAGLILSSVITPLTGFILFRYWVFKIKSPTPTGDTPT